MAVPTIRREQLAKEWGISPNVIDNMLQRGILRRVGHGLIDYEHAKKARQAQNPAARERGLILKATRAERSARPPDAAPDPAGDAPEAGDPPVVPKAAPGGGVTDVLMRARTSKVVTDARISELNFKKLAGTLVDREQVKADAHNAAQILVSRLRAFPSRLGPMLAPIGDTAECVALIDAEVAQLITELQEAIAAM